MWPMEPAEKLVRMLTFFASLAGLVAASTWLLMSKEIGRELRRKRDVPHWTEAMRLAKDAAWFTAATMIILVTVAALYLFELR